MTEQEFLDRCKFQIEAKNDLWPDDIRELVRITDSRPSRQKFDEVVDLLHREIFSTLPEFEERKVLAGIEILNRRLYGQR